MEEIFAPVGSACFGIFVGFVFRYFLEIHFPQCRRCQAAELIKVFGADEDTIQNLLPTGDVVRTTVPVEMRIAEAYRLSWNW